MTETQVTEILEPGLEWRRQMLKRVRLAINVIEEKEVRTEQIPKDNIARLARAEPLFAGANRQPSLSCEEKERLAAEMEKIRHDVKESHEEFLRLRAEIKQSVAKIDPILMMFEADISHPMLN